LFGSDLSSSIVYGGIKGAGLLLAIPFLPVIALMVLAGAVGGNVGQEAATATEIISSLSEALWKPQFFAIFVSAGSLIGFGNHRKRTEELVKGKADFIAAFPKAPDGFLIGSQEET